MRPTPLWSDPVLLDRYLSGEATPDESRAIDHWLAANPEEGRVLDAVRAGVTDPYGPVPAYDANVRTAAIVDYSVRAVRRMRRQPETIGISSVSRRFMRLEHGERPAKVTSPTLHGNRVLGTHPLHWRTWYTLAGIALTVLTIVVGLLQISPFRRGAYPGGPVSAYATENGERANITLPDGNTVALDVASRLEVPADYLAGNHTLRLSGEALFTIQHHAGTPVTVLAGQTITRVLGTSFMVRHYTTDSVTTVAVQEGKVTVGTTVVTGNQLIEVRRRGAANIRLATASQFSFATGTLILDDLDLPQAIPELDRWYDADIRLGDPALATRGVGGEFAAGSLADLTTYLEVALDVRVVRDGQVLTLYPNPR
ncbi:MAG TPA: FecR domain-containing protein [Gemmatimonadaceae bacterium]|jgi:transmembrane sensor|nr:FecR domain-containing protein [Gemmatimonadaceae bacterium]